MHDFCFESVLPSTSSQYDAYQEIAAPLLNSLMNGINCAIIAYGQTGSGKTHTMTGSGGNERGIIPRLLSELFGNIANCSKNEEYFLQASYVQIYQEKLLDLLQPSNAHSLTPPKLREDCTGWFLSNVRTPMVTSQEQIFSLLSLGDSNRKKAATLMNQQSSRSHTIFLLYLKKVDKDANTEFSSILYLVDLAGSENVNRTGATGTTLDEAKNINRTLHALKNVIKTLVESRSKKHSKILTNHVPYRDSLLTKLLQNSLGGNSRTTMVICVSPEEADIKDTFSSLIFGQMTTKIKVSVRENVHHSVDELQQKLVEAHAVLLELREQCLRLEKQAGKKGLLSIDDNIEKEEEEEEEQNPPSSPSTVPKCFLCPLTNKLMENPVICTNGQTYEKRSVLSFYRRHLCLPGPQDDNKTFFDEDSACPSSSIYSFSSSSCSTSPILLIPNYSLLDQIQVWMSGKHLRPRSSICARIPRRRFFFNPSSTTITEYRTTNIIDIPYDCYMMSFSYLPPVDLYNVTKVCLLWCRVSWEDSLWKEHVLSNYESSLPEYKPLLMTMREFYMKLLTSSTSRLRVTPNSLAARSKGFSLFKQKR